MIAQLLQVNSAKLMAILFAVCLLLLVNGPQLREPIGIDDIPAEEVMLGTFVAVSDTGFVGEESGLSIVSAAVNAYCQENSCDFGLMAGDNIYEDGATGGPGDAAIFEALFAKPFGPLTQLDDGFRIYTALGNHDWYSSREGALAQVAYLERTRPFYMDGIFYSVKPPSLGGDVEVFVIDTEMLLSTFRLPQYERGTFGRFTGSRQIAYHAGDRAGGHPNALPTDQAERRQVDWLSEALRASDAKWKVVLAHHPLWQSRPDSKYTQSLQLRKLLLPVLCKFADIYVSGHQHTLEVHTDDCGKPTAPPLVHVVSGAGSKVRDVNDKFRFWQLRQHPQVIQHHALGNKWGFTHFSVSNNYIQVRLISVDQNGVQKIEFSRAFQSRN